VSQLEKKLRDVDASEANPLFLGSSRRDTNAARLAILTDLDSALKDLGKAFVTGLFLVTNLT
jgi:hypothetical protein